MNARTKKHSDPAQAEVRRNQILTAAVDCFRRKGFHGAGMAEISRTAQMSAGHIYNYFESKEAIIENIIEKDLDEMFTIFDDFEDKQGDISTFLLGEGVKRFMDYDSEFSSIDLEMIAEASRNVKIATLLRKADSQAKERVLQLLTSEYSLLKETSKQELDSRVNVIFSVMSGLLLRKLVNPELTKETVLIALRPVMKTLLTPFE